MIKFEKQIIWKGFNVVFQIDTLQKVTPTKLKLNKTYQLNVFIGNSTQSKSKDVYKYSFFQDAMVNSSVFCLVLC